MSLLRDILCHHVDLQFLWRDIHAPSAWTELSPIWPKYAEIRPQTPHLSEASFSCVVGERLSTKAVSLTTDSTVGNHDSGFSSSLWLMSGHYSSLSPLDWSFSVSFSDSFSIAHSSNNNPQRAAYLALFCSMFLSLGILSSSLSQLFLMWTAKEIPLASTSLLSALLLFPAPSYWTCLVSISAWNYPKPNSLPFPLQPATLPVFDRSLIPNISTENPKVIV